MHNVHSAVRPVYDVHSLKHTCLPLSLTQPYLPLQ